MTTLELIQSLNSEQEKAFIAVRDELMTANAAQNSELVFLKNAEIQTLQNTLVEIQAANAVKLTEIESKYAAVITKLQEPNSTKEDAAAELEKGAKARAIEEATKARDQAQAELDKLNANL